jgi:YidC/Oxa1 family membrane protein insertase
MFTTKRGLIDKFTYDFMKGLGPVKELIAHPEHFNEKLFGVIDLTKMSVSSAGINWILMVLVLIAVFTQYMMTKQTAPKQSSTKRLRDIMNEAADGKQTDQSEMNAVVMGKMTKFLPIMMFFVMMNLPGALVLYYAISNGVAIIQQGSVLKKDSEEMIELADEKPVVEYKKATAKAREKQAVEGNVIRIVAKDNTKWQSSKKEKL